MALHDTEVQEWLATRKQEALKIDPKTAVVECRYVQELDPYGVDPDLPEEYKQFGRVPFARRPDGDIWVCIEDLPEDTIGWLHQNNHAFWGTQQIIDFLEQHEAGSELCRKHRIRDETFQEWRRQYGKEALDKRKLKELEQENQKLKKLLGESTLHVATLQEKLTGGERS